MLDHILATAQIYEREHGMAPNVIYLNTTHLAALQSLYPELFDAVQASGENFTPLGMHLVIVNDPAMAHPRAARLQTAGSAGISYDDHSQTHDSFAIR